VANATAIPDAEQRFHEASENLYNVFGKYPKPPPEECIDTLGAPITEAMRAEWEKPLREYSDEQLNYQAHHSLCIVDIRTLRQPENWVDTLRLWLPRMLQGLSRASIGLVTEDWYIAEKFIAAHWLSWPEDEVEAVDWIGIVRKAYYGDPKGLPDWFQEPGQNSGREQLA
jgi:hypothetical protein